MATQESAILCLFGKPACGKSVLSQFILRSARDEHSSGGIAKHDAIASFFFYTEQPELRRRSAMLQALLYDILSQRRPLFPHFQAEFRKRKQASLEGLDCASDDTNIWREEDLENILRSLGRHPIPEKIYILIDGLDEAANPKSCAEVLSSLTPQKDRSRVCFKILVATQRDGQLEGCLKQPFIACPGSIHQITLQERNSNDIFEYTQSFLNESLVQHLQWTREDISESRRILVEKSRGIFLWVKLAKGLVDDYLNSTREASLDDFRRYLRHIPEDIRKLYSRLLDRLTRWLETHEDGKGRIPKVKRMFRIATQAKRALSLEEFRDVYALPFPGDNSGFNLEQRRATNIAGIIPVYTGNFLEVHEGEESGM